MYVQILGLIKKLICKNRLAIFFLLFSFIGMLISTKRRLGCFGLFLITKKKYS